MNAKSIIKHFDIWQKSQKKFDGEKVSTRDFDCWMSGYVAGYTFCDRKVSPKEVIKIMDEVVDSKVARKVGVYGTLKQEAVRVKI